MNLYAFVENDGVNSVDYLGHSTWSFEKLKAAYQSKDEMLKGKNFHQTALDAINSSDGGSCAARLSNAFNRAGYDLLNDAFKNTSIPTVGDGLGNRV